IAATPRSANVIHHGVATSQADSQRPKARGRPARMNSATPQNSATTDHAPATSTISCIGTSVSICDMRRESERRDLRRLLARADDDLVRGEQQAEARGVVATAPAQRLAQESIGQHLVDDRLGDPLAHPRYRLSEGTVGALVVQAGVPDVGL